MDPFTQWYDDEKLYYQWIQAGLKYEDVEDCQMPSGGWAPDESRWQTGHYLNVINDSYIYTGFAISRYTHEDSPYSYTYGQTFASSPQASNLLLSKDQPFTLNGSLEKTAMTVAEFKETLSAYIKEASKPSQELIAAQQRLDQAQLDLTNASEELENIEEAYQREHPSTSEPAPTPSTPAPTPSTPVPSPVPGGSVADSVKPGTSSSSSAPGTAATPGTSSQKPASSQPATLKKGTTFTVGSLKYKVTKAGASGKAEVQVVGSSKSKKKLAGTLKIPATVKYAKVSCKVTSIKAKAFKSYAKIKKVTLGSNLKTIGASAFQGCTKLTTVAIGKSVTTVGSSAFKSCKNLKKVTISSSKIKKFGSSAFKGTSKKAVVKAPTKKVKAYTKLLVKAGLPKQAKVRK